MVLSQHDRQQSGTDCGEYEPDNPFHDPLEAAYVFVLFVVFVVVDYLVTLVGV